MSLNEELQNMDPKQYLDQLNEALGDIFFVEIGAMDGKSFDLLYDYVKKFCWRGILVEPLPDLFEELKSTYADCNGLVFENVAITNDTESRTMYRIPTESIGAANLPPWTKGISSLYRDRNAIGGKNGLLHGAELPAKFYARLEKHIVEQPVSCVSLKSLLQQHRVDRIDVLQIDTEGYDYQVFKQFDFSRFKPYFMKVEVGNLVPEEYKKIISILELNEYEFHTVGLDVLAYRPLPS